MPSGLDKSLSEIISGYGPKRRSRGSERRGTPYSSKSKHTDVFVGNLPWGTTWQELKDLCQEFGDVKRADILQRPDGLSRGCGTVWFFNSSDAEACIEGLDGHELDGRELKVKFDEKPGTKAINKVGGSDNCQVWVGNLPFSLRWQNLKDMCKEYGYVKNVTLGEHENGGSKGYAIVTMQSNADARALINGLNGSDLDGREIAAKLDEKTSNQGRAIVNRTSNRTTNGGGGGGNCQVWVGNLPFSLKWPELKDICKEYGFVKRVDLDQNENGYSKGYAIVTMENNATARALINGLNGADLDGREITAKFDEKASNQGASKKKTGITDSGESFSS